MIVHLDTIPDDRPHIERLREAVNLAGSGGTVLIPPGVYDLSPSQPLVECTTPSNSSEVGHPRP